MNTFLVTVLGAALLLLSAGHATAVTLQFDPAVQTVPAGSTVTVELVISDLGNEAAPSLSTFDLDVTFDDSILSFLGFAFGDPVLGDQLDLSGLGSFTDVLPGAGTVNVAEVSFDLEDDLNDLQAGAFTLGTLSFSALSAGVSDLGLSVNALGDASGDPLAVEIVGGRVAVSAVAVPGPASLLLVLGGVTGWAAVRARRGSAGARGRIRR
jgi:hypothetical protein